MNTSTQAQAQEHVPQMQQQIDTVASFLFLTKWTNRRLAKACGVSTSALSQFLSGQYAGDNDKVWAKVQTVIARESEKAKLHKNASTFVETSISKKVFDIARACHLFNEIGVCYSDAGLGKTESAREYARLQNDSILIEADPGYTSIVLFKELHDKLGGGNYTNLHQLFQDCVDRLRGSGRMLIIDEAEQLPYKALELVRRLYDKAGIGILLTGMPKLLGNLRGIRGEYAQIYSRVGMAVKLEPLTEKDTRDIIATLLPELGDLWKLMHEECRGNTRRLFKLINRSQHIAGVNHIDIDKDVISMASGLLKIEVMY